MDMRNDEGFTALHLAAYKGNLNIIHLLLKNHASIHLKNVTVS